MRNKNHKLEPLSIDYDNVYFNTDTNIDVSLQKLMPEINSNETRNLYMLNGYIKYYI